MTQLGGTPRISAPLLAAALAVLVSQGCVARSGAPEAPSAPASASAETRLAPRAEIVDDFALLDHTGAHHSLYANGDARAIVLVSYTIGCPILRWSLPRVEELVKTYADRDVRFFYVDASPYDDRASLAEEVREFGISVPILADEAQLVLSGLKVRRTAEAILIDPRDWHVAYRGKIDDRATYGGQTGRTPVEHLGLALDAFLVDREIAVPRTEAEGCMIFYEHADAAAPSYPAVIAPILREHCVPCHTDGGLAPWAMTSFERISGRSTAMREVVRTKRMPPWHADPLIGVFENDASLPPLEAGALVRWIEAGSPRGDGPDPLLERPPPAEEWPLGPPDLVVEATEQHVPASGIVFSREVVAEFEFPEDAWVRGVHLAPSNAPALHHALILVEDPERPDSSDVTEFFAFCAPSMRPRMFPEGTGKLVPTGAQIRFQLHYTPTGRPEIHRPRLGLYLLDAPPPVPFESTAAVERDLDLPPGEAHYRATGEHRFLRDALLFDLVPLMHYSGREVRYEAHYPDGSVEVLLSVPNYDFDWPRSYHLAEPKLLPAGTLIECHALFDNSAGNSSNPDPTQRVVQGTYERLAGYMNYHLVPEPEAQ